MSWSANVSLLLAAALAAGIVLRPGAARSEEPALIAPGAQVEKVAGGFAFTEGPAPDADGNVYFTDQPKDRILKWSVDGGLSVFMEPAGRSNGLCFDAQGRLWACADEKNELWRIDVETGERTVLVRDYQGKLLNGPNDVWVRPDGGAYFTDPLYPRSYWQREKSSQQDEQAVYYLPPSGELRRVASGLRQPNGLIGTPDGKRLYLADIGDNKTYVYNIETDGSLSDRQLFCRQGSDGVTLDERGNVYLTGRGVAVYNPQGEKILQIDVPENWTANVCFGGPDHQTLFITASTGLYTLKMNVRGAARQ